MEQFLLMHFLMHWVIYSAVIYTVGFFIMGFIVREGEEELAFFWPLVLVLLVFIILLWFLDVAPKWTVKGFKYIKRRKSRKWERRT